jgi:hypothetical protein
VAGNDIGVGPRVQLRESQINIDQIGVVMQWLTPEARKTGDPSLRLKNGYAQDDGFCKKQKLL